MGIKKQTIIKILVLIVFVGLACALAFLGIKTIKQSGDKGLQDSSELDSAALYSKGDNEDSAESKEPTHADLLDMESEITDEGEQILLFPKDDVYGLTMTDANYILLSFEKRDNKWIYTDDSSIEINEDRIDKILNYLCDIRIIDYIQTTDEEAEGYGINQDSPMFIIKDKGGNETIISLGKVEDNGNVYFAINYDFSSIYVNQGKLANVQEYSVEELIAL